MHMRIHINVFKKLRLLFENQRDASSPLSDFLFNIGFNGASSLHGKCGPELADITQQIHLGYVRHAWCLLRLYLFI